MYEAVKCSCISANCQDWHVTDVADVQGVKFTYSQAQSVSAVLNSRQMSHTPGQWPDDICSGRISYAPSSYGGFILQDASHGIPIIGYIKTEKNGASVTVCNYPEQTELIAARLVSCWNAFAGAPFHAIPDPFTSNERKEISEWIETLEHPNVRVNVEQQSPFMVSCDMPDRDKALLARALRRAINAGL